MRDNELIVILKKVIFIIIFSLTLFFIFVNILKLLIFDIKIKNVINSLDKEKEIEIVDSDMLDVEFQQINNLNPEKSHNSGELGFYNSLDTLNGSEWGDGINILLVGSDKHNFNEDRSRADVIIVLRIIKSGKILSISIPRDTLVPIQEGEWRGYSDKIGHSLYWGGMNNLKKNVEWLIGSRISRVAIIDNFKNFEAFLAVIGGVYIDKELEGETGIRWIRNRNFTDGDIERCKRQQVFLKNSTIKLWQITKKGKYFISSYFFDVFKRIIYTDLSKNDFNNILYTLRKNNFDPEKDFLTAVLPGEFGIYNSSILKRNDLTCWLFDNEIIDKMQILFYSENENIDFIDQKITLATFIKLDLNKNLKNAK